MLYLGLTVCRHEKGKLACVELHRFFADVLGRAYDVEPSPAVASYGHGIDLDRGRRRRRLHDLADLPDDGRAGVHRLFAVEYLQLDVLTLVRIEQRSQVPGNNEELEVSYPAEILVMNALDPDCPGRKVPRMMGRKEFL